MTDELETFDGEEIDAEPYEGLPDFDAPQTEEDGAQDREDEELQINSFARVAVVLRTWVETLMWYITHRTSGKIGFNPDNMCLKICRTARNIPAKYLTAKEAQDSTPIQHRIFNVRKLRRGMVLYFDDPNDSNRAGHIVTMLGRVRGFDPDSLHDILVDTNSVVSGEITTVRASYFVDHWGDAFVFGATMLNGVELDVPGDKPSKIEKFNNGGPVYNLNLLKNAGDNGREHAALVLQRIETQIKRLPDTPKLERVREFKDEWRATREIDMSLLDAAVKAGLTGLVKNVRDEIARLLNGLPDD